MRSVLITGSSTGIGRAAANRLATHGWRVLAGVRSDADAAALAGEPGEVIPVRLDVADEESIAVAAATVAERCDGKLEGLVSSAGVAVPGPLETVPLAELRRVLEVNVVGQIAVVQAMAPMLRRGRGRILLVGSIGGRIAFPYAGPYHASKFALEGIADTLRAELRPQGVGVALLEPGPISTPIWEKARAEVRELRAGLSGEARELYAEPLERFEDKLRSADRGGDEVEKVAAKVAEALQGSGARYPVGRGVRTLITLRSLLPDAVFDRIAGRVSAG